MNRHHRPGSGGPQVTSGAVYRQLRVDMIGPVLELEARVFTTIGADDLYDAGSLESLAAEFPEGCFVAFSPDEPDRPVGFGFGIRVDFDFTRPQHSEADYLDASPTLSGHQPVGGWYYGTDIVVDPAWRRRGIGGELYDLRKRVVRDLGLGGIVAGGVIPGYANHRHLTPDGYIDAVRAGDLYDPTLSFQLGQGFETLGALHGYLDDPAVGDAAALIVWENPDLPVTAASEAIAARRRRLG